MSFSSHVTWTFATRLLMIVNSVVAGIIVARWLGAKGVGELAVINVAVATVVQLGSFGLPSSNTYFIAQDHGQLRTAAIMGSRRPGKAYPAMLAGPRNQVPWIPLWREARGVSLCVSQVPVA